MNIKKHKKEIRDYENIKSKIAYSIGHIIQEYVSPYNPIVHYFDVKKHLFKNKITLYIYCERPGLLIGKAGATVEKLKSIISEEIKKDISVVFFEFQPINYPIYDID